MKRKRFKLAACIISLVLLASCSSQFPNVPANGSPSGQHSSAASAAATTAETTAKSETVPAIKPVYTEPVPPMPQEPHGVVYKGYLLDYYEALYGPVGPVSLENACRSLDIKISLAESPSKKPAYDYDLSPETVTLERGGTQLVLKISGNRDEYHKNSAYPSIPYKACKNGSEIDLQNIFSYKGCIYVGSLADLLQALDVKYCISGDNTYVDSETPVEIKGRILCRFDTKLEGSKNSELMLVYNYDAGNKPGYGDIELVTPGDPDRFVKIYDSARRGKYPYYYCANMSEYTAGKDLLLKVDLWGDPSVTRTDTVIYRISSDRIESVYSTGYSTGLHDYTFTGLSVETDMEGGCTFRDVTNTVNKTLDMKIGMPGTIFNSRIDKTSVDVDEKTGECTLAVLESISFKMPFLYVISRYKYENGYFGPVSNTLTEMLSPKEEAVSPVYEYSTEYDPPVVDSVNRHEEITGKLDKITVVNMNNKNNAEVTLKLPSGWYATGIIQDKAEDFEFESEKNKSIKKAWAYQLFNSNIRTDFYQYGVDEPAGNFDLPAYYRQPKENILMRNHAWIKEKAWSGETLLGRGDIYIVGCDLPKEKRADGITTYDEIYAWIPVEGEKLAYNLAIDVPVGKSTDDYLALVKRMLVKS